MKINLNKLNEAYRNFIDKSPYLFFSTDLEGNFLFINKAAEKITALQLAELQKSNLENIVMPEYQGAIKELFQDDLKIENIPPLEIEVMDSSGNRIPLEIQLIGVKDENGKPATLQWMAREVSERKKAKEKIEQLYKKAQDTRSIFMSVLNSTENIAVQGYNIKGSQRMKQKEKHSRNSFSANLMKKSLKNT